MGISRFVVDVKQPPEFAHALKQAWPELAILNLGESGGDMLIGLDSGKVIAIEYKSVPDDLVASIQDRRLFRQAQGIRELTPWAFLLLSHDPKYDERGQLMALRPTGYGPTGWTRDMIDGALTHVESLGVKPRVAWNGLVEAVRLIINWTEHADAGAVTQDRIQLSPFDLHSQDIVNLLCWFHGLGPITAKAFLDFYPGHTPAEYLVLATTPFGKDKPRNWTNYRIAQNRTQLGLANGQSLAVTYTQPEWEEEPLE